MRSVDKLAGLVLLATLAGCGDAVENTGSAPPKLSYQPVVVDHSKDEIEFHLRRSLSGVEALIEDNKVTGSHGIEALQQRKAELQQQLQSLTSAGSVSATADFVP